MSAELRATLVGATAVGMWAALALLTDLSGNIPPFQLTALTFAIAFGIGLLLWARNDAPVLEQLRLPWQVWLLGIGGLFGYHFFYFVALRNAPTAEVSLIAYLWPLLIVLLSTLLLGERLRWFHSAGTLLGLLGAFLLVTNSRGVNFQSQYLLGYVAALVCALTWSTYSVLSRRFGEIPTTAVGGFCGGTAVLALICHLLFEEPVWPQGWVGWLAVLLLGLGPVGAAFFTWDIGVKRGNIKLLGALSYLAPLFSTLLLVLFGRAQATWGLWVACALIIGGAVLAAGEFVGRRQRARM